MSIESRIAEARAFLAALNFDAERSNERSALVLLALASLTPDRSWASAEAQILRTVELMSWIREHYGRDYKPNTRETIRRRTLHQFVDAGFAALNPDDPTRPVNSPWNCYQLTGPARVMVREYGSYGWGASLAEYLVTLPGLVAQYERAREIELVPVTLPDGSAVELTPGGQNLLIKEIVEGFCPRWTPGGRVLYIGDAGRDDPVFDAAGLGALGVVLNKHGKLPDLIVHLPDRNWLVLIEAASSHGPVDAKRFGELRTIFAESTAGLVYVSCFPSRAEMRKHLTEIAWETEVWCADNATHLIHFNGARFLGPYE